MNTILNNILGNVNSNNSKKQVLNSLLMSQLGKKLGFEARKPKAPKFESAVVFAFDVETHKPKAPKFESAAMHYCPGKCHNCPFQCAKKKTVYDEWNELMMLLERLAAKSKPDYDYKDIFGRPVRIFPNFVQVGYEIIPRFVEVSTYEKLTIETRDLMIEVISHSKKYVDRF